MAKGENDRNLADDEFELEFSEWFDEYFQHAIGPENPDDYTDDNLPDIDTRDILDVIDVPESDNEIPAWMWPDQ